MRIQELLFKKFIVLKKTKKDPLIVHYLDYKHAKNDVIFNKNFYKLYKKFCPDLLLSS